jgi:hypothetical protein
MGKIKLGDLDPLVPSSRGIQLRATRALNLGTPTLRVAAMDVGAFISQSVVGNDPKKGELSVQRKLDPKHANGIAQYILKSLLDHTKHVFVTEGREISVEIEGISKALGTQEYYAMAGFIVTLRRDVKDLEISPLTAGDPRKCKEFILYLGANEILYVSDGQHRREALRIILEALQMILREGKYTRSHGLFPSDYKAVDPSAEYFWQRAHSLFLENWTVQLDIHCGLHERQERQLFHDTNNLQKQVPAGLAQSFDGGNPINQFTQQLIEELFDEKGLKVSDQLKVDWQNNSDHYMARHMLTGINARLFLNSSTAKGASPLDIEARKPDAVRFWEAVTNIPNFSVRDESVVAQPALLKTIARVFHEIRWTKNLGLDHMAVDKFLADLPTLDFSHGNRLWDITHLEDNEEFDKPNQVGKTLREYLNVRWKEKEIARTIAEKIHFGTRHNESILVLPHIIRYLANLPVSLLVIREWEKHLAALEKQLVEENKTREEEDDVGRKIEEAKKHLELLR